MLDFCEVLRKNRSEIIKTRVKLFQLKVAMEFTFGTALSPSNSSKWLWSTFNSFNVPKWGRPASRFMRLWLSTRIYRFWDKPRLTFKFSRFSRIEIQLWLRFSTWRYGSCKFYSLEIELKLRFRCLRLRAKHCTPSMQVIRLSERSRALRGPWKNEAFISLIDLDERLRSATTDDWDGGLDADLLWGGPLDGGLRIADFDVLLFI